MDNNIIIKTEKLTKQYGEGEDMIYALNNVDLEVHKGEFIAVTGESGSGKTTLLPGVPDILRGREPCLRP